MQLASLLAIDGNNMFGDAVGKTIYYFFSNLVCCFNK